MGTYINTKEILGEQAAQDALIAHGLTDFTDSDVTELRTYAFYNQSQMLNVTLPNLTTIRSNAFRDCSALKRLRVGLEKNSLCSLSSINALQNTGRAIIFVPPNLVSNYRSATNWSTYMNRIYGDGDSSAPEWDESEITDTESEIATRVANGTAASFYKLGQYKSIDFGTLGFLPMQIIGINKDELSSGNDYAQLTWFPMILSSSGHRMNPSISGTTQGTGSIGGWEYSEMRTYLNDEVWPLIPETWRNIIKSVKKYSRIYNTSGQVENDVLTNDMIWIPSSREMGFPGANVETLGPVYDLAFFQDGHRIRKRIGSSNGITWWLRSAANTTYNFACVNAGGISSGNNSTTSNYVGFGFCT